MTRTINYFVTPIKTKGKREFYHRSAEYFGTVLDLKAGLPYMIWEQICGEGHSQIYNWQLLDGGDPIMHLGDTWG